MTIDAPLDIAFDMIDDRTSADERRRIITAVLDGQPRLASPSPAPGGA